MPPHPTGFFGFTVSRPVAVFMITSAFAVFGAVSYRRLALNLMPNISYPSVTIRTAMEGAAPEDVERGVTEPVEEAVGVVGGLVQLTSVTRAGTSDVTLEFEWGTKIETALQEVREKLDHLQLPREAKRPVLLRYDPNLDPIMRIGISGDRGLVALRSLADEDVRRSLESTSGVAAIKVRGGREEEIRVEVHRSALTQLGIDPRAVAERLGQENLNQPSGSLVEGDVQYLVRTLNEFRSQSEIGEIVISRRGEAAVKLKDIASIRRVSRDPKILARIDGKEAVLLDIYREADANIVSVADAVRARLEGTPPAWWQKFSPGKTGEPVADDGRLKLPTGVKATILSDQSTFVRSAIKSVFEAAWQGALLAIIVLFLFLRSGPDTLIIGVSIPLSIIATFGAMHLANISLNVVSLGGLALGVGMMVDASIVVLDSIARCREEGDDRLAAAIRGTREVGLAVSATTLTTIVVFFPIAFVEGIAGQIFRDQALTVCISLMASMGVSLFFVPMLASRDWSGRGFLEERIAWFPRKHLRRLKRAYAAGGMPAAMGSAGGLFLALLALPFDAAAHFFVAQWGARGIRATSVRVLRRSAAAATAPTAVRAGAAAAFLPILPMTLVVDEVLSCARSAQEFTRPYLLRVRDGFGSRRAFGIVDGVLASLLVVPVLVVSFFGYHALHALVAGVWLAYFVFRTFLFLAGIALAPFLALFQGIMKVAEVVYPASLKIALRNRLALAGISVAAAVGAALLTPRLSQELIPTIHQGEFLLEVSLPVGTPIEETDRRVAEIERDVLAAPGVASVTTAVGVEDDANRRESEGENTGRLRVRLKPAEDLAAAEEAALAPLRDKFRSMPDVSVKVAHPVLFSFRTPLELEVRGHDIAAIRRAARMAESALQALPGLTDVQSTVGRGSPEIRVTYNRPRLAEYGLDINAVATILQHEVLGQEATKLAEEGRKVPVRLKGTDADTSELERVAAIVVNPGAAAPVRLGAVATFSRAEGPNEIRRISHQRAALVRANLRGYDLAGAARSIEEAVRTLPRTEDVQFTVGGQSRELRESGNSLLLALVLAVFLVYVVMAAQFESLLHPFLIMFTIPMGAIGVVAALLMTSTPVSVVVLIGLIVLAGVAVDDAIVFVDAANQMRRAGMNPTDAIFRAAKTRLRPILMTSLTTILGLIPMAMGIGEGAELQAPLAITVLGGMVSSTFLTLILIPVLWHAVESRKAA